MYSPFFWYTETFLPLKLSSKPSSMQNECREKDFCQEEYLNLSGCYRIFCWQDENLPLKRHHIEKEISQILEDYAWL